MNTEFLSAECARAKHPLVVWGTGADAGLVTCPCGAEWDLVCQVSPSQVMRRPKG